MASITPKNGRAAFITAQDPHTYWELNSTNLGTGYGDDPTGNDDNAAVSSGDISTSGGYEGMNSQNDDGANGWFDIYIVTDAAMLLYIPAGLAHGTVYGLFHNGGGTNAQGGFLRATTTGVEIALAHNAGSSNLDCLIEEIPDADLPGWFALGFQFSSEGGSQGDMGLWINGTKVRNATRTYQLAYGSGDPDFGDNAGREPTAASVRDPSSYGGGDWGGNTAINSSGILIANFACDNPGPTNSSPAGNGDTWYTDYYDEHVTAAAPELTTSGTLNAGGSMSTTVTHKASVAATLNGGASITATATVPSATSVVELKFESLSTPSTNDKTVVWIRGKVSSSSLEDGDVHVDLYEGATLRKANSSSALTTTTSTISFSLSTAEHDTITDWSDLRVRIWFTDPDGTIGDLVVYDVWLVTAEASAQPEASGTLNAGGSITAIVTADHTTTGELNGGGSIAATYAKTSPRAAELNAGASIAATVIAHHSTSGELNAGGSIAATITADHAAAATLNAGGSITPTVKPNKSTTGEVNSGGSISATVTADHSTSGELNSGGSITPVVAPHKSTAGGTLEAGGSIAATYTKASSRAAEINAGGSITASVTGDHQTAGTLNAGGSLDATVTHEGTVAVELNAGGSIQASAGSTIQVSATLHGGGSVTATVTADHATSGTLNGGGSVTAAVAKNVATTGILNSGGSITATVAAHKSTSASLSGGGSITGTVTGAHAVASTLNAGGSITATAVKPISGEVSAELNAGGSLAATVVHKGSVASTLNAGASVTAAAEMVIATSGTLNGGGSIVATVIHAGSVVGELNAGASIAAAAEMVIGAGGTLNGGGSIAATVTAAHTTAAALNVGGSIAATVVNGGTAIGYTDLALKPLSDPEVTTDHWVYGRYKHPTGTQSDTMTWKLMEGTTVIASGTWATSSTTIVQGSYLLSGTQANTITDYTALLIRLEPQTGAADSLRVADVWLTVPFPPPLTVELNAGGSIDVTVVPHKITRAFPDLSEGLMGPALNGGGDITGIAEPGVEGQTSGILNAGGSITATVTGSHNTTGTLNVGASITASTISGVPGEARGTLNGGASIHATVKGHHATTATLNGGGSITVSISNWIEFGRTEGAGIADYSNEAGRATDNIDVGLSDDGSPPGETDNLHSPGETD